MYENMRSQNTFSRTKENNAKMGAYYTNVEHCHDLGKMFLWPDAEVCVLEPSIGDASAVLALTVPENHSKIKIFGVEVNDKVAELVKQNPHIEECLNADFLEGVRIKNNAFSFCFGNPPYMEDDLAEDGKERVERQFLDKVHNYLCKGGILVWVIPYVSFSEPSSMRFTLTHFEMLVVYRFRDKEYEKYHQIVMVLRKKNPQMILRDQLEAALKRYELSNIPVLPTDPPERFEVFQTDSEKLTLFCKKEFDIRAAHVALHGMETNEKFVDMMKVLDEHMTVPEYVKNELGKPPIPLKKDSLYLLATSGSGQGLTGSEETKDLHLQRGIAEVIEDSELMTNDEGDAYAEKVSTRTKVTMTVVENSGKITVLE